LTLLEKQKNWSHVKPALVSTIRPDLETKCPAQELL
jgi:hypothetical protein